ncbi:hypothetical protein LX81_03845 [Palleronia aestuarii]|uniref:Uncharacterized protein n=1 Tax=Palleronia aestuarii TaxID=568105 RepID=A0A2W7MUQ3_9RHOB|nr:hypothetical protein [Palleronia aestuarii]PZX11768.1 hypothetical protein LX81_03845 [Palleronia aestuarii]
MMAGECMMSGPAMVATMGLAGLLLLAALSTVTLASVKYLRS